MPWFGTWVVLLAFSLVTSAWPSDKKGVGLAELDASDRIEALDIAWYYTWKPYPIEGVPAEKFVPMLRSRGGRALDRHIAHFRSKGKVPVLLALNEPNVAKGDNMSVEEVVQRWPEISDLAEQIGSPAPSGALGPWFDQFYVYVGKYGLRLDFMALHLYSAPDAASFLSKIDAVYDRYRLPIWITEFAVADWDALKKPNKNRYSESEVLAFMRAVLPELEKRPYIIRYAWFGASDYCLHHEEVRTSRLFESDGSLTPLGRFYADFTWPPKAE
jgi:hypothetical protein